MAFPFSPFTGGGRSRWVVVCTWFLMVPTSLLVQPIWVAICLAVLSGKA